MPIPGTEGSGQISGAEGSANTGINSGADIGTNAGSPPIDASTGAANNAETGRAPETISIEQYNKLKADHAALNDLINVPVISDTLRSTLAEKAEMIVDQSIAAGKLHPMDRQNAIRGLTERYGVFAKPRTGVQNGQPNYGQPNYGQPGQNNPALVQNIVQAVVGALGQNPGMMGHNPPMNMYNQPNNFNQNPGQNIASMVEGIVKKMFRDREVDNSMRESVNEYSRRFAEDFGREMTVEEKQQVIRDAHDFGINPLPHIYDLKNMKYLIAKARQEGRQSVLNEQNADLKFYGSDAFIPGEDQSAEAKAHRDSLINAAHF